VVLRAFRSARAALHSRSAITTLIVALSGLACTQRRPGSPDAWQALDPAVQANNRGVAFMEQYDYAAAVEAFAQALGLAPKSGEVRVNLAMATFNRAARGDLEHAEQLLDEVLQDEPNNVRALYFRGITHQYGGRDEPAISCFERALRLVPDDACTWYLLARSKSHLGQPYRADLERAVELNPALASAYYDLLRLAAQEGQEDEARAYQERFAQLRQSPLHELVVMPHYGQMGPLATVRPLSGQPRPTVAGGELEAGGVRAVFEASPAAPLRGVETRESASWGLQLALADVNGDGRLDIVVAGVIRDGSRGVLLLLAQPDGRFGDATEPAGLTRVRGAISCALGDYDNDNNVDLFVSCAGPNYLFGGRGDGTFEDVTASTGTAGADVLTMSATFLDADHDGDLDIYVCNATTANQLLNNDGDGTFTDIAEPAGVACATERSVMLAPADLDGDRDTDLIVFNEGGPARVFFNDRFGKYHAGQITAEPVRADWGGVAQDFNGDGRPDLLVFPGPSTPGRLCLSKGSGPLEPSAQFDGCARAISTWDHTAGWRVIDIDLDGDLDVVVLGQPAHFLLNDGAGRFVARAAPWPRGDAVLGSELADLNGDGVPDLVRASASANGRIDVLLTKLTPPANWLAIVPTGDRGPDQRTRSPVSGFGTRVELRCGLHSQVVTYTGLSGALSQSIVPLVLGLDGAPQADYVALVWPDGVTQCERELATGRQHRIQETERRISSCPVLFAWDGARFGFVSDFAGVGGLGYLAAPGQYAQPQVCEHVKIEPEQLAERDGAYELRLCEPMEEVAYVDQVELLAVDHPAAFAVYPDERLVITGPPPTHRLLCPQTPVFAASAIAPDGTDCTAQLTQVDHLYAYQPEIDRRFFGFCKPHALILDFSDRLAGLAPERVVYLFINGWIEYPYSQSTFAASQAGVTWQPLRIERWSASGQWEVIVPDAGAPGGLGRTIAVDLTGKLLRDDCRLRISTNLEIYYDQIFIAADRGTADLVVHPVPLSRADLRPLGFPLEYSPDGRLPTIYSYDTIAPDSALKILRGAYTRYGAVESLLADWDDRYVILGTGDEIALTFDARGVPPSTPGQVRSFILISHAYCKDMDLYTAEPDTVAPLPFRGMSAYPYPPGEHYPAGPESEQYQREYNTRLVP
jgi:Flp pilus assembly protein TadD